MLTDSPAHGVRARDAATLIIVRGYAPKRAILFGQRSAVARFMPGRYVFPGGAVAPGDGTMAIATPLDRACVRSMGVGGSSCRAARLALAAVRETYEETGLMLGLPGRTTAGSHSSSWRRFSDEGLLPSLKSLRYVGRAITPTFSKIRYHARFFLASAEHVRGEIAGDGELDNVRWIDECETQGLQMADVTRFMLDRALALTDGAVPELPAPVFSWRRNKRSVVWR